MRFLTAVLFVAACTALNPAFDPDAGPTSSSAGRETSGEGGAHGGGSSGGEPTSVGASGVQPGTESEGTTTLPASESGEGGSDASSGTSVMTTLPGDTGVVCPVACGECEACEAGSCVPAAGGSCTQPVGTACEQRLWGMDGGDCRAYQGEPPTCVAPGVCDYACAAPGAVVVDCDDGCVRTDNNCEQGGLVTQVSVGSVCVQLMSPPGCSAVCNDEMPPDYALRFCNQDGKCQQSGEIECGYRVCTDDGGCPPGCDGPEDCVPPATCKFTQCMP